MRMNAWPGSEIGSRGERNDGDRYDDEDGCGNGDKELEEDGAGAAFMMGDIGMDDFLFCDEK